MKTLRHPLLSLAAVFLALAIGVVLGARVLPGLGGSGLVGGDADARHQYAALRDENKALSEKLAVADQFDEAIAGRTVRDALAGKSVVLFRTPDAQNDDVEGLRRLVAQAGGSVTGTIGLTREFVEGNAAEKLRSVVNSPILPAGAQLNTALGDPASQAGDLLGIVALINRDSKIAPVDDAARDTVLTALRDTGFLTVDGTCDQKAAAANTAAANTAVVVTGAGLADDAGNQGTTVARLAAGLAPHGSGTVLAGRDGSAGGVSAVALVRADAALASALSTVDDIGTPSGRITTVLALQAMIGGAPPGRYGVGQGATSVTIPQ